MYTMTHLQVELYFNQALKLLGSGILSFLGGGGKPPGIPTEPGVNRTLFRPEQFKDNESYDRMLRSFGGSIKHG